MAKGKDPAFLFYPGDWLGGTLGMSFEEKGAYLEVLVLQWNCHRITSEAAKRLVGEDLWLRIAHKFQVDAKGFFNQRLETEKIKRRKHSEKQTDNANKRWAKKNKSGNATALPLENENINEDKSKNIVLKGVQGENWLDQQGRRWTEVKNKWFEDFRWREKICRDTNLSMVQVDKLTQDFVADLELKDDYKDVPGLKRHFVNWYKKHHNGSKVNGAINPNGSGKLGTSAARIKAAGEW